MELVKGIMTGFGIALGFLAVNGILYISNAQLLVQL